MKVNVSIIGLGLIGGSLGLALKRNRDIQITGFDNSYSTMQEAYRRGIIDTISVSIENASEDADVHYFRNACEYNGSVIKRCSKLEVEKRRRHYGYWKYKSSDYGSR